MKPINLTEERTRRLEAEVRDLKKQLETSLGHDQTSVSFQESVLVDRFLPEGSAVTFRLGAKPKTGPDRRTRIVIQLFEGNLELFTLDGCVRLEKVGKSRMKIVEKPCPKQGHHNCTKEKTS